MHYLHASPHIQRDSRPSLVSGHCVNFVNSACGTIFYVRSILTPPMDGLIPRYCIVIRIKCQLLSISQKYLRGLVSFIRRQRFVSLKLWVQVGNYFLSGLLNFITSFHVGLRFFSRVIQLSVLVLLSQDFLKTSIDSYSNVSCWVITGIVGSPTKYVWVTNILGWLI